MNINKILTLAISTLCIQLTFAQNSINELNSVLQTNLKICITDKWYNVISFKIKRLDGVHFEGHVKLTDSNSYVQEKEYIIDNYIPYYIEDGAWHNINGEYQQKGDTKKIHFYNNPQYGTDGFDLKWYRPDGALGHHETLNEFYILFSEQDKAQKFVSLSHKLQGNTYNSTPWLRTLNETTKYQEQSSKEIFESISKDFKQYDIESEQVHHNNDWTETTNLTIKYKYPNIIISHTDVKTSNFYSGNKFRQGTVTITFSISDARFEFGRESSFGGYSENVICFYTTSGLEISYKGKKDIVETYNFYASKIVCKNLLTKLRVFKKKILEENYQGQYGFPSSSQKSNPNKQKKILGGKYVQ